jgi:hypothetical protein
MIIWPESDIPERPGCEYRLINCLRLLVLTNPPVGIRDIVHVVALVPRVAANDINDVTELAQQGNNLLALPGALIRKEFRVVFIHQEWLYNVNGKCAFGMNRFRIIHYRFHTVCKFVKQQQLVMFNHFTVRRIPVTIQALLG